MTHCAVPLKPLARWIRALIACGLVVAPLARAEVPVVLPGGRWEGALDPRIANGGLDMVIEQTTKAATLEWQSFDIGAENSVRFEQPSASAVALNRIFANDPSVINGKLFANGQIYLINQNGILFDKNAQVDVNTLVASTLNIDDAVFEQGILGAIQDGKAAFVADAAMPDGATIEIREGARLAAAQGGSGRIMILAPNILNAGDIETPDGQVILAASHDRVYLAQSGDTDLRGLLVEVQTGGDVKNVGSIIAERGNVSLLGLSVNQEGLARATSSISLNGSIRLVAGDSSTGALEINTARANSVKGRFFEKRGGELVLGADSVTEVIPVGTATATDGQVQPGSYVDMAGHTVTLEGGAQVKVTGGEVNILAKANPNIVFGGEKGVPGEGVVRIASGAVIDVSGDDTTTVAVSRNVITVEARGTELADSPLQRSGAIRNKKLLVDVRKGTPFLNEEGAAALIARGVGERLSAGGTVNINSTGDVVVEDGAGIDISGGLVTYTGDKVVTSKLVAEDGRIFDISAADPNRTYIGVLGEDLKIDHAKWGVSEILRADVGSFEPGYVEGKDAGSFLLRSRRLAFNGELLAGSSVGDLQRAAPDSAQSGVARPFDQRPYGGSLSIDLSSTRGVPEVIIGADDDFLPDPPAGQPLTDDAPTVLSAARLAASGVSAVAVKTTGGIALDAPLTLADNGALRLSAGKVDINSDIRIAGGDVAIAVERGTGTSGNGIVIPDDAVALNVAAGISIDVSGRWTNDSPRVNSEPATAPFVIDGGTIALSSGGDLTLAAGSVLDVSAGARLTAAGSLESGAGGSIALESTDNEAIVPTTLSVGAELRGYSFDNGGSLSLTANKLLIAEQAHVTGLLQETLSGGDPRYTLTGVGPLRSLLDGLNGEHSVLVDSELFRSGGFDNFDLTSTRGGLAIAEGNQIEPRVQNRIIDTKALTAFMVAVPVLPVGTAGNGSALETVPTGAALDDFTRLTELPDQRRGPVDLSLISDYRFGNAEDVTAQELPALRIGAGAEISVDPGARIALASDTSLFVDGRISAPAGAITLNLDSSYQFYAPQQMIWLGPEAELSARGAVVLTPNELGLRQGEVRDAGNIALRANFGSIVTAPGSRIDVDGSAATLDLPTGAGVIAPTTVAGRAGEIHLTAAESMLLQGELSGHAARAGAMAGVLSVTLDPTRRPSESEESNPTDFVPLAQRYPSGPRILNLAGYTGAMLERGAAVAEDLNGQAFLSPEAVVNGGFDALDLAVLTPGSSIQPDRLESMAMIRFPNDLNLTLNRRITLDAPVLSSSDADVQLNAAYVAIGSTDTRFRLDGATPIEGGGSIDSGPTDGTGTLRVAADLIDLVGDNVLQGFGTGGSTVGPAADLVSNGDIRLRGVRLYGATAWEGAFRVAGDLRMQAQQIYPTTLSDFEIGVEAPTGSEGNLEICGQSGQPGQPVSAGGRVTLNADHIALRENASVRAPIGEIALTGRFIDAQGAAVGAHSITLENGSVLSTSAAGLNIPFGYTQFKKDLVLSIPGEAKTLLFVAAPDASIEKALPEKRILLNADAIDAQQGAVFDLSGGGSVRATEFIPGPGGSKDILLADLDLGAGVDANTSFAIVPLLGGEFAPFDPIESPAAANSQGIHTGDTLILEEGINGVAAGEYAILPARYALFGGYLVTPVSGTQDLLSGQQRSRLDGTPILAGRFGVAGVDSADSRSQGFSIEDGARVRLRAEYAETSLDQLFADAAVRTPRDAGNLTLAAGSALRLAGSLTPTLTGGRGSAVDILGNEISIRSQPLGGEGIELIADDLAGLMADSLLIGATRSLTEDGLVLNPRADLIEVDAGVTLDMRELILVADRLHLGVGSAQATRLTATGEVTEATEPLLIDGNAAMAMVSNARGATLNRTADSSAAELSVAEGVTLAASGSIVLDANGDVTLAGTLAADGGTLSLGGSGVSLGETDGLGLSGLVLSNADLAVLAGSDLSLRSGGAVTFYGALENAAGGAHQFNRLDIDAQGIVAASGTDTRASLDANDLELRNRSGVALASTDTGTGDLTLQAKRMVLDEGSFAIRGYGAVTLDATEYLLGQGAGDFNVTGALMLDTPVLTAAGGSERVFSSTAALSVTGGDAQAPLPALAGLGARMTLEGASIDYAGNTRLPSGEFMLTAEDAIDLNTGASINVAGRDVVFATQHIGTPGGAIRVESATADITVNNGVVLDVSGAPAGGAAGRIELSAPHGAVALSADAVLRATEHAAGNGEFVVDANLLAVTDAAAANVLSTINQLLGDDAFLGRRDLRVRTGDLQLALGEVLRAREVKLVADQGRLTIDGGIDASGTDGGAIVLAAGDSLDVNGTLDAHATSAAGDGGRVELATLDADDDDLFAGDSVHDDVVNLNASALIDVRGGAEGSAGSVLVRALAYDANGDTLTDVLALGSLAGTVQGADRADIEAVHAVTDSVITATDRDTWLNALNHFMDSAAVDLPAPWRLVPGLEVASAGDLTLQSEWDLYANSADADLSNDWRFGAGNDVPGILTLRAAGAIRFDQSLSDAFLDDRFFIAIGEMPYDRLGNDASWRYRIIAGADTAAADILATTQNAAGDILLAAGTLVRTGTGDIELAAADAIDIGARAAIYTAGQNAGFGALGESTVQLASYENLDFDTFEFTPATGEAFLLTYLNKGQMPISGGDIRIRTGGDLLGYAADVSITDWQPRIGGDLFNVNVKNLPTYWAIAFESFTDGIGTLGGGDISADIGGDLRDLAIALPTTGQPGQIDMLVNDYNSLEFASNQIAPIVSGGGDLQLNVAGDLVGGAVQLDRGVGSVRIGGDLGNAAATQQPYFAIADTQLTIETRGDLNLGGVFNATALPQRDNQLAANLINPNFTNGDRLFDPLFFTYTASTSVEMTARNGDISLRDSGQIRGQAFDLYPPTLKMRSLQGGLTLDDNLRTYPAPRGQLELLAEGDIRHTAPTGNNFLIQSDADPARLPSPLNIAVLKDLTPENNVAGLIIDAFFTSPSDTGTVGSTTGENFHAAVPVHAGDPLTNLIVSRTGSIFGKSAPQDVWEFILAKQTAVSAGGDIQDMSFKIQHNQATDLSLVSAGGSITQTLSRGPFDGLFAASKKIFESAGPGRIDFSAGENIDLGTSQGIVAVGDTGNPALGDVGAAIALMAGMAGEPDYDAFIDAYLNDSTTYHSELNAFLSGRGIDVGDNPVATFRSLSRVEQRELIFALFFNELKESGKAASQSVNQDYTRGFAAIATLFPEVTTTGSLSMPVSVVKTIDGGAITLLAPYGDINAGATFRALEKKSDQLGVITGRGGDIDIFLDGDLQVNRERVFALQGDLVVWSSNGDIDAGKGAKTVTSVPDPIVTFDANGNAVITFPPAVDGSGLNAENAYLFAPRGAINAGDAGIRTSGNLTIGAVEVIGTDNIDVGGVSVGVPVASAGVGAGMTDASAVSSSASSMTDEASSLGTADAGGNVALGLMSVEVLGFGESGDTETDAPNDNERRKRRL